jgi:Domain of unknown function (DUF4249)
MEMRLTIAIVFLLLITGCEEVVDRTINPGDKLIVVEGQLTNELTQHTVRLSWSVDDPDDKGAGIAGATVVIMEGATTYSLTESPLEPGEYLTPMMRVVAGKVYTLHIRYAGQDYFAQDSSVPVEPMPPLEYRVQGSGYVLTIQKTGQDPNYIRHGITWKGTPRCDGGACQGMIVFYDLKTLDVNEGTRPAQEEFVFPAGSTVVRRKYSVSPKYRSYLRAVLSETEWRGGPFDVERANAPTNLSNGAIGFFAVCTTVIDSTVVK